MENLARKMIKSDQLIQKFPNWSKQRVSVTFRYKKTVLKKNADQISVPRNEPKFRTGPYKILTKISDQIGPNSDFRWLSGPKIHIFQINRPPQSRTNLVGP